jgi:hypothetical protein
MNQNVFDDFLTDKVALLKDDGTIRENIPASVSQKGILIQDVTLPIAVGDKLIRKQPSGLEDVFVVDDPGYHAEFHGIPAAFQIRYHRADRLPQTPHIVNYEVSGPNARINVQSQDYSTNTVNDPSQMFSNLRYVVDNALAEAERAPIREAVNQMESTYGTATFLTSYTKFLSIAADHLTVFAPFLPALAQLLLPR